MGMLILDQILIAIKENRPEMYRELRQKMCHHEPENVTFDAKWNSYECMECHKTWEPTDPMLLAKDS